MKNKELMESIREKTRFYLSTPERAAEALLFVRAMEVFAEELKSKVKERAVELMDRDGRDVVHHMITDPDTGEVRNWEIRKSYGSLSKEYRAENVIAALGDKATRFLKVSKTTLDTYLKRASAKGDITMEQVTKATADPIEKMRKGAGVIMREIKSV